MRLVFARSAAGALCFLTPVLAQNGDRVVGEVFDSTGGGQVRTPAVDHRLMLGYGVFDPLAGAPPVSAELSARADVGLFIVQFGYACIDADRRALRDAGAKLVSSLPHNALIVRMGAEQMAAVARTDGVRWVGPYHPAYRLEGDLLTAIAAAAPMPVRGYNLVMADKVNDKAALARKIAAVGGKVTDRHDRGLLMTAELSKEQLIAVARFDEVLWIDRETAPELDMDNARIVQGSNYIETAAGYTGAGLGSGRIRGHVYEGVEFNHPDFTVPMTNVRSGGQAQAHGHCTAGIVFGNGTSAPQARGHAPGAQGFYTTFTTVTAGFSRNMVIDDVVNVHNCLFTTASWGNARTTVYNSISADADDIVFDHRIPWTQSQSNSGNQESRPQAWAKNVFSIGGMRHNDNADPTDDFWGGGASTGPAADGRIKPDLCNFYDDVWTSDLTGSAGYASGNSFQSFGGTSAATPITAGLNALAIEMYTDHILCNPPRVHGGSDFENRPYAQTLKALMIANASLYPWGSGVGQSIRSVQGWGYGNVRTIYDNRARMMIIPEDKPIQQGQTHTYFIDVAPGTPILKVCMSYLDPAGSPAAALARVNDLTLEVTQPNGVDYWGNAGLRTSNQSSSAGGADNVDTVECVIRANPMPGMWRIDVTAPLIAQDAHVATAAADATYALVAAGGARTYDSCARTIPDDSPASGTVNVIPFGSTTPALLSGTFATNNGGSVGGAVYFDLAVTNDLFWNGIDLNTGIGAGTNIQLDVYTRIGTHVGNEGSMAGWTARTAGLGVAAASDSPSKVDFNAPLSMNGGTTYGVAIVARNFDHDYTNGANVFADANLTMTTGSAANVPFTGSPFTPRSANLNIRYRPDQSAWHNQRYQTVLRCQDLGPAGSITGLSFAPTVTTRHLNRRLRIRMVHRPAGYELSNTFATNIAGGQDVLDELDYVWHTTADVWNEIGLTSPFAYNGTDDVVIEILARGNHNQSSGSIDGFHRGATTPRIWAEGWPSTSVPTVASGSDTNGTKIRVEFACPNGGAFGSSCGPLRALPFSTPLAGTSFWYDVYDAVPNSAAIVQLGLNQTGVSLTGSGFTNCFQWNDPIASVFYLTSGAGFATHVLNVPPGTMFDGLVIYGHWYNLDPAQPGGLTASNYIRSIVGSQNP